MDKILAFLKKLGTSLTVWVAGALVIIAAVEPVFTSLVGMIGGLSPKGAVIGTAVLLFLARCRSFLTSLKSATPPTPTP